MKRKTRVAKVFDTVTTLRPLDDLEKIIETVMVGLKDHLDSKFDRVQMKWDESQALGLLENILIVCTKGSTKASFEFFMDYDTHSDRILAKINNPFSSSDLEYDLQKKKDIEALFGKVQKRLEVGIDLKRQQKKLEA